MDRAYDIVTIGGGPAGLTAGLYAARGGRNVLLLEEKTFGGQIMDIYWIENYPGFADGISGPDLGSAMMSQAMNYGLELELVKVEKIELQEKYKVIKSAEADYIAKAVIIASGAHPKNLGVPGEKEFVGAGVAYCALCDGSAFAGRVVVVAGGGDAGITEALYLTRLASKVIVIELMPRLTANHVLQERAFTNPKIEIHYNTRIEAIIGDSQVRALKIVDVERKQSNILNVDGLFVRVGLKPNTEYLKRIVPLDSKGQVLVNDRMETEVPGIFAAGDVRCNSAGQIATAVGDGVIAALSAERFLTELESKEVTRYPL